jgi:outer membrane protein assembly factor BamA
VSTVNNQPVYLKTPGETLYKMSDNQVHLNYRQTLYTKHVLTFSFRTNSVADSVMALNNKFLGNNINQNNYLQLSYTFAKDTRDNKAYPLKGAMYSGTVSKTGLAKFDDNMDYFGLSGKVFAYKRLGKKFDIGTEIYANVDFTDQLSTLTKWVLATMSMFPVLSFMWLMPISMD